MPLDAVAKEVADPNLPLRLVSMSKYQSLQMSPIYIPLNLTPLLGSFKQKVQAWQKLPLLNSPGYFIFSKTHTHMDS